MPVEDHPRILRVQAEKLVLAGVPLLFDNVPVDPELASRTQIRMTILDGMSKQQDIGDPQRRRIRTPGIVVFTILSPVNTGDGQARELAEEIKTKFGSQILPGRLKLLTPYTTVLGQTGPWWQLSVTCPFELDFIPETPNG